jgi:hypothetical protein
MPLNKDWREFIELLNSNKVDYLVVGAFAVAFHGYPRFTADLDLFVRPTEENAHRVVNALNEFGFRSLGIQPSDLRAPGMIIQLGVKPNRIYLLTGLSGLTFDEAWESRVDAELDGIETRFIGRAALLQNKEHTGRQKDLGDADELRKRIED